MDIQEFLENVSKVAAKKRSETQFTLLELIYFLENVPNQNTPIAMSATADSYRGYYSDLAFEPGESTVAEVLKTAKESLGKTFTGYKGGDFTMTKITPIWISNYGCCSGKTKLIGFTVDKTSKIIPTLIEDNFEF